MMGFRIDRHLAPLLAAFAALLMMSGAATASPDGANPLLVSLTGTDNLLQIAPAAATDAGNRLVAMVTGDRNGGFGQAWSSPLFSRGFAAPGVLRQSGRNNMLALAVEGQDNLFSVSQTGTGNSVVGHITGAGNVAAVVQQGHANLARFSQAGTGNSLAISQSSW